MKKYWFSLGIAVLFLSLTGFAYAANMTIQMVVNGRVVESDIAPELKNGHAMVPLRWVAEALGAEVTWDNETHSVNIQTEITKDEVEDWIRTQGKEKNDYHFEGLFVEEVNLDRDPEPEVFARIDGAVHLGNFFVFDKQSNGTYTLIFEQPWRVVSWDAEYFRADGMNPLYNIVTRTGGTGVDVREVHLMYMDNQDQWVEAWNGKLKDRSIFQDNYHIIMGSYQFNDDKGQLFYWQTEMDVSIENNKQIGDSKTTMKIFELQQGKFLEKE